MKRRIYYGDTDAGGIVYHPRYLAFCEEARSEIFFNHGITFDESFYVVKEINAKFLKPAKLGDTIDIKTAVTQIRRTYIVLIQEIYVEDKKIFEATITLVHLKDNKPAKIPPRHLEVINEYKI